MRISYIGPLPPIPGGIAQHGSHLIAGLRALGHEVNTWSWASQYPGLLYKGKKRDQESEPFAGTRFALRWWNPISWVRVGRAVRSADLVILQWVTPFHGVHLATVLRALRPTPAVCIVHNVVPHEHLPFDKALTRLALKQATQCIVHSKSQEELLHGLLPGVLVRRVSMPPHLSSGPSKSTPSRPPLRLIQPGYVRPYKGVEIAIRGMRAYIDRHPEAKVELSIVGDFWQPTVADTRKLVDTLDLGDVVHLRDGYLSDEAMLEEIASHHAALLPYSAATQSGIVPAVLGAGRPVITTNVGGLAEQVRDGVDSVLCPPDDPEAVADAIEMLEARYESYQQAAATAWPEDSWNQVAAELVRLALPLE